MKIIQVASAEEWPVQIMLALSCRDLRWTQTRHQSGRDL